MIEWNIRVGDLIIVASLAGTCLLYAFKSGKFAESIDHMKLELTEMKDVAKDMTRLLTTVAVQSQQLTTAGERLNMLDKKIEDMRRGDGYIRGPRGVDKEY